MDCQLIIGTCLFIYICFLVNPVCNNFGALFFKRYGRRHRIVGLLLLLLHFAGFCAIFYESYRGLMFGEFSETTQLGYSLVISYDVFAGVMGIVVTQTAVNEFRLGHNKKNIASGVLDENAIVTSNEMQEHVFYQILNLVQILYLHCCYWTSLHRASLALRLTGLLLVTSPWLVRHYFPINKFADNYTKGQDTLSIVSLLYRTKKYQYIFYKHFLLHGLNTAQVLPMLGKATGGDLVVRSTFRRYWLCLNCSYVFEFFLQSLVRGKYLRQEKMLQMQQLLMFAATLATIPLVFSHVNLVVAVASTLLNFAHRGRGHDVWNLAVALAVAASISAICN
eukprot:GSChrysophyteH1.ASY1.ANO1.3149.1 assembled CDS